MPRLLALAVAVATWGGGMVSPLDQAQAADPQPPATGAISGVVQDAGSGRPIAGAIVTLMQQRASPAPAGPALMTARQVTDAGGRFVFTRLPVGDFAVIASRTGYSDGGYGRVSARAGNRRIALGEGQWFPQAAISMWRLGSIGGTVVDEAGEPVVGVWVRALSQMLVAGQAHWTSGPSTRTDDRGAFRFGGLTPTKWVVQVPSVQHAVPDDISIAALSNLDPEGVATLRAIGRTPTLRNDPLLALDDRYRIVVNGTAAPPPAASGRPRVYGATFHPAAASIAQAVPVDLGDGDDRVGIDVVLRPVPAYKISGVVDGLPKEGRLTLRLVAAGSEGLGRGNEIATTLVTAGAFTFLNVPAGAYTILASELSAGYTYNPASLVMTGRMPPPPGQMDNSGSASAVTAATQGTMFEAWGTVGPSGYGARQAVEVGEADLTNVTIRLTRGITVAGHVAIEAVPGSTAPAIPLSLVAEAANGDPALGQPRAVMNRTDPARAFKIEGLQPGEYLLRPFGAGVVKSVTVDGKDYGSRPIAFAAGRDVTGVVVTVSSQTARLGGVVYEADRRPVTSGAIAIVFPVNRDEWTRYGLQPAKLKTATIASSGNYQVTGLPGGDYFVIAVDDAHVDAWKDPAFLAKVAAAATKVTVGWGETKTQDLTIVQVK